MILPYVSLCQPTIFGGPPAVRWWSLERNTPQKLEVIHCVRGVISPLLANFALDGMEQALHAATQPGDKVNLVRYADDLIVTGATRSFSNRKPNRP